MIRFLLTGLLRDRSRSLLPLLVVFSGVLLTVFMHTWSKGQGNEMIKASAAFATGHVKVMSRAYAAEADQVPNDLALTGVQDLLAQLRRDFPAMQWTSRTRFGGLLDVPDEHGETKAQGPLAGLAVDLLSPASPEPELLNLKKALKQGRLPERPGEVLVSDEFARTLGIKPGDVTTLFSSGMFGGMATANFAVAGTVRFGVGAMDRGMMIADVGDIQNALAMDDAAGEIVGFTRDRTYQPDEAKRIVTAFNARYAKDPDLYAPQMVSLRDQNGMGQMIDLEDSMTGIVIVVFLAVMSLVLWNAGLMGNLRRYGEIGIRLAIGEDKGHLYRSLIAESLMVGVIGSVIGTAVALALAYYLQAKGLDFSSMLRSSSVMLSDVYRPLVTPASWFVGFIPGLLATLLGTAISGANVYRRQTSQLIKELEQ
jgi:putative ABC transport system permease protein